MDAADRRHVWIALVLVPVTVAVGWFSVELTGAVETVLAAVAIGGVVFGAAVAARLTVLGRPGMGSRAAMLRAGSVGLLFAVPAVAGFVAREIATEKVFADAHVDLCDTLGSSHLGPCDEALPLLPPVGELVLGIAVVVVAVLLVALLAGTLTRMARRGTPTEPPGPAPPSAPSVVGDDGPDVSAG